MKPFVTISAEHMHVAVHTRIAQLNSDKRALEQTELPKYTPLDRKHIKEAIACLEGSQTPFNVAVAERVQAVLENDIRSRTETLIDEWRNTRKWYHSERIALDRVNSKAIELTKLEWNFTDLWLHCADEIGYPPALRCIGTEYELAVSQGVFTGGWTADYHHFASMWGELLFECQISHGMHHEYVQLAKNKFQRAPAPTIKRKIRDINAKLDELDTLRQLAKRGPVSLDNPTIKRLGLLFDPM